MSSYSIVANNVTLAGATTVALITPPAAGIRLIEILSVDVSYKGTATSAQERIEIGTVTYAGAPTLTSVTPTPLYRGDPASSIAGGTAGAAAEAGINASAEGTPTRTIAMVAGFNVLNGMLWMPPPGGRVLVPVNGPGFYVRFPTAPATLTGWHCTVTWSEV